MSLFTTHIGYAIRDCLEGKAIEGEQASRMDPFSDEQYEVIHVDCTDASNPIMMTSGGTFKIIILRIDETPRYIEPERKPLPRTITGSLADKSEEK